MFFKMAPKHHPMLCTAFVRFCQKNRAIWPAQAKFGKESLVDFVTAVKLFFIRKALLAST